MNVNVYWSKSNYACWHQNKERSLQFYDPHHTTLFFLLFLTLIDVIKFIFFCQEQEFVDEIWLKMHRAGGIFSQKHFFVFVYPISFLDRLVRSHIIIQTSVVCRSKK